MEPGVQFLQGLYGLYTQCIGLNGVEWMEENKGWAGCESCDSLLGAKRIFRILD